MRLSLALEYICEVEWLVADLNRSVELQQLFMDYFHA